MALGLFYLERIIPLFGGKGALYPLAKIYYIIVVIGVPVLGFCMMEITLYALKESQTRHVCDGIALHFEFITRLSIHL